MRQARATYRAPFDSPNASTPWAARRQAPQLFMQKGKTAKSSRHPKIEGCASSTGVGYGRRVACPPLLHSPIADERQFRGDGASCVVFGLPKHLSSTTKNRWDVQPGSAHGLLFLSAPNGVVGQNNTECEDFHPQPVLYLFRSHSVSGLNEGMTECWVLFLAALLPWSRIPGPAHCWPVFG
ncbi:hypothetical protein DL89DRAFT_75906 [Linderina pennispora]|uniref:Uncharacterized protein n=1 Tax=Linderina pennispora TaxID=61395 RepID=A0A1Y1VXP4_9FUNG|nr:uncharacterized protein DL89DRAFT_75906 [Linderina pennispora]ORX66051.1 hypothetical protein DL89DRAFT_75906 [Linderina pennispora]